VDGLATRSASPSTCLGCTARPWRETKKREIAPSQPGVNRADLRSRSASRPRLSAYVSPCRPPAFSLRHAPCYSLSNRQFTRRARFSLCHRFSWVAYSNPHCSLLLRVLASSVLKVRVRPNQFDLIGREARRFLRHYRTTDALSQGVPLSAVAEMMGNSPEIVAKVYSHLSDKKALLMDAANAVRPSKTG
jgi:hypothetical protein